MLLFISIALYLIIGLILTMVIGGFIKFSSRENEWIIVLIWPFVIPQLFQIFYKHSIHIKNKIKKYINDESIQNSNRD